MVYSVPSGNIKTPKSVLFPTVVKSLCNNSEIVRLINHYRHGISYSLIEEIETEQALQIISEQKEKRVIIPDNTKSDDGDSSVALMVADIIDNLGMYPEWCRYVSSCSFHLGKETNSSRKSSHK